MEDKQESIFKFAFDEVSKDHIKGISQWAIINAVLSFAGLAITTVEFIKAYSSPFTTTFQFGMGAGNELGYFVTMSVTILLNVFLYIAGMQMKRGIDQMSPAQLTRGWANLRTYFKIYGIVIIIAIVLMGLFLLFLSTFRRF
jgi:hypothetical protein